ncbi:MAG: aminotransferase class V-fold PLP-dependent enzyme [Ardenticatenales bacterium]|nr:aminotransferase class V-fold PLP-dependent enzyme [Ardenticatenales bacterium]
MTQINGSFCSMVELLDRSGELIAEMVQAEAARVTSGAAAAIALGTAACITGMNGNAWEGLPTVEGFKNEIIIQRSHRYKYDRMVRLTGARLVEVDASSGEQLDAAIGPATAAIVVPAHLDALPGTCSLAETISVAHHRHIPVLVDAAYLNYPVQRLSSFTEAGADLVCFSAKYFWGPNSGGFICGRKSLIRAVAGLDFTQYESGQHLSFGRPFKLDRTTIVGTVFALREWLDADHETRWERYAQQADRLITILSRSPAICLSPSHFTMEEALADGPTNCVVVTFTPESGLEAQGVAKQLAQGSPRIETIVLEEVLVIVMETVLEGQELEIAAALKTILQEKI